MNRREFVALGLIAPPLAASAGLKELPLAASAGLKELPLTASAGLQERNSKPSANVGDACSFDADLDAARQIVAEYDVADDIQPRFFPSVP